MRLIVSCLVSLTLLFNMSFAGGASNAINGNNLFIGSNSKDSDKLLESLDSGMVTGMQQLLLMLYKIGYCLAIIVTIALAIKLLLTSPAKKAEVKAAVLPYLIGLLLLIAGVPIAIKVIEAYTILF